MACLASLYIPQWKTENVALFYTAQKHRLLLSVPGFIAGVRLRRLIGKRADGWSAKEPTVNSNKLHISGLLLAE
jgi:hypothetical protein